MVSMVFGGHTCTYIYIQYVAIVSIAAGTLQGQNRDKIKNMFKKVRRLLELYFGTQSADLRKQNAIGIICS